MSKRRVVVTGLGIVSPVGQRCHVAHGTSILRGRSGIAPVTRFDVSAFRRISAASPRLRSRASTSRAKDARRMDAFMQYGVVAGMQADARLRHRCHASRSRPHRCGDGRRHGRTRARSRRPTTSTSKHALRARISPFFIPASIINMVSGHLSIALRAHRPESRRRHRLHHLDPRHRLGHAHDPVRRCGRHARRRLARWPPRTAG